MSSTVDIARKIFLGLLLSAVIAGTLGVPTAALATKQFDAEQYSYGELTTGDADGDFGWDEGVLIDATGVDEATDLESGGNAIVSKVDSFSTTFGITVTGIYLVVCLARFAGRGILELSFGEQADPDQRKDHIPTFFKTRGEGAGGNRRSGASRGASDNWFLDMVKETLLYGLIIIGVWAILGVATGIVHLFFEYGVDPAQQETEITQFSLGGITIDL